MAKRSEAIGRPVTAVTVFAKTVFVISGGGGRASLLVRNAEDVEAARNAREEDATIDAEDVLAQAEEANAVDPVG